MSTPTFEHHRPTGSRVPASTDTLWERSVAMVLLRIIPVVAFVLAMLQAGGHTS